jgi:hypothetical protein
MEFAVTCEFRLRNAFHCSDRPPFRKSRKTDSLDFFVRLACEID